MNHSSRKSKTLMKRILMTKLLNFLVNKKPNQKNLIKIYTINLRNYFDRGNVVIFLGNIFDNFFTLS